MSGGPGGTGASLGQSEENLGRIGRSGRQARGDEQVSWTRIRERRGKLGKKVSAETGYGEEERKFPGKKRTGVWLGLPQVQVQRKPCGRQTWRKEDATEE